MSAVTAWSRTAASNNSAPPDGAPEGWAPSAVNNVIREMMTAIVNEAVNNACKVLASVAGTDTITASCTPDITAYSTGMLLFFTPAGDNTGATTLNIDSLGAKSVVKGDGTALGAGDLQASTIHAVMYDGTNFVLLNPKSTAFYDATTANFTGTLQYGGVEVGFRSFATSANGSQSGNYTVVQGDNSKFVNYNGTGGHTITLDSALTAGTIITVFNSGSGNATLSPSSGTLSWFNGSGSIGTGNRTLAVGGVATCLNILGTSWWAWGTGLS